MAETTMAPAERPMRVGWRFHPTDQELVSYFLRHKLKADDLTIDDTIPEINVCKGEPRDLLDWATTASSTKFDESQCFFFSPRDYKYSNSNRWNRTTPRGFWKVTCRDRKITCKDTNKVIGTKKTLVYYKGRVTHGIKTNWIIHEYHDFQLSQDQRTHVLCWLRENKKKKTTEKIHQLVDDEKRTFNHIICEYENQTNICTNSEEQNGTSICTNSEEQNGTSICTNSEEQNRTNICMNSEEQSSMIQVSSQLEKDSMYQISSQSNGINPIEQIYSQSYEALGSMIESPFRLDEELASIIHTPLPESNFPVPVDLVIQTPLKSDEKSALIIHTPPSKSNFTIASEYANLANVCPIPEVHCLTHMEDSMMTQTTSQSTMEESENFDIRSFFCSSPSRDDE